MTVSRQRILTVLFWLSYVSCGGEANLPAREKEASTLSDALRVTWKMSADNAISVTKKEVAEIAKRRFSVVSSPKAGVKRVRVVGELTIVDNEGALVLEGRVTVPDLPFPVVARIAAAAGADRKERVLETVESGARDLAGALKEMIGLLDGTDQALFDALRSPEPDVQVLGAKLIALRAPKGGAKALCPLLADLRDAVAEAAAEGLMAMKDPSSVSCVIGSIRKQSLRSEVRVIEILGAVGGDEAIAYLEMTAGGHELEEVRRLSSVLLENLKGGGGTK